MKNLVVFFVGVSLSWIAWIRTDGFTPDKIYCPLPLSYAADASLEVKNILSKPFCYLGKGRQCFVFESQDGRYVLKFFNRTYFQMPLYSFLNFRKEKNKREKRRSFFENSYEIAYREFGEEILYLHLGPSGGLPLQILNGPAHRCFQIDLNRIPFVLQRKGEPFYTKLDAIYSQEGLAGLRREIDGFIAQITKRIAKGIADGDNDVEHNWGYVDEKIFHLDPGRLYYDPTLKDPKRQKEEWHSTTFRFARWLDEHYPEAAMYLQSRLQDHGIALL